MEPQQPDRRLRRRDVVRRFERAAPAFDGNDFVHRQTFEGLIERMQPMQLKTKRILDLGSATGTGSRQLAKMFRRCHVTSLDVSGAMLSCARRQRSRLARISELRADAMKLPLKTGSVDLVFANMLLPWIDDLSGLFSGVARVLRNDGLFVFSTLGPSSLSGLRHAWSNMDNHAHVHPFIDMHNIADAAMQAGLCEPIVDVDSLVVSYRDVRAFFTDLTATGARNCHAARFRGLTGKKRFNAMTESLLCQFKDGVLNVDLELVYGHAWGGGPLQSPGEFRLDPSQIGRRRG